MDKKIDEILNRAMKLSKEERLLLAHDILSSVVHADIPACALISDKEIVRRAEEVRSGKAKLVDAFEALDGLKKKFSKHAAKAA